MKTQCTRCDHYARIDGQPAPEYLAREINQVTGLCWAVCDLEREASNVENTAYTSLSEEY